MNLQAIKTLERARYRVVTEKVYLDQVYRLRYRSYRSENTIPHDDSGMMTDRFDETANCIHVAVDFDDKLVASVRLHLISKLSPISPTLEVFPELLDELASGKTILDPTRFVIDPAVRKDNIHLHFLVLRIPFLATIFYDVDIALAPVRSEHVPFYRRYLGYGAMLEPRTYPGLSKPIQLLTARVREQRAAVLARTPVFGPIGWIPNSSIAFPDLSGVFPACRKGGTDAA